MILGFVCRDCGQRADAPGLCPADGLPLLATDDPLLGHEIGRYRLARLLGEGGMGRVYLAVQPMIGSRVAIKILSDQCARSPELLERFFAEARAVNLIRHENIVSVMDLAKLPDGRPYIVMEFIEGQTLAEIVQGGPVPLGGLVQVASEIFSALAAAHAIGIVHRDLKPDNVLVTAEGHAKVLDFGIAKLAPQLQQQLSPRTQTGALLGTPQYMAPEQITGAGNVDARSDVYAAGVMLFEAITGGKPFRGDTLYDLMRAHLEQPPPSLRALRPELPAALEQVILTALAKAPEQRFQSVGAMNQAMQAAAQALPADQWRSLSARARASSAPGGRIVSHASRSPMPMQFLVTEPAVDPRARRPARRTARGWLLGGGLALALLLVIFGVVASQRAQPRPSVTVAPMPSADGAGPLSGAAPGKGALPSVPAARGAAAVGPDVGPADGPAAGPAAAAAAAPSAAPSAPPSAAPSPTRQRTAAAPARAPASAPAVGAAPSAPPAPSAKGPIIVGGGSAADHGVHIGPGVEIGPNVVIGSSPPPAPGRTSTSRPADYDPRRFDPVAYLPKARALAQSLLPDAGLTSFSFDPVFSDGRVDLTVEGRDREYEFRSPARSPMPPGTPRNLPVERACRVQVAVGVRTVSARVLSSESCDDPIVRAPRCGYAGVWKHALLAGVPPDFVARIAWLSDQKWFFDTDLAGNGGGVLTFTDRCQ